MPSLRPILKISPVTTPPAPPSSPVCGSLHVHFPPTPTMTTRTDLTHSSFSYDRKSIIVLPNACALPARGERDVDAVPAEPECDLELWALVRRKRQARGAFFHPRTYEALEAEFADDPFSSSLLLSGDSSSSSLSSLASLSSLYRVPTDTLSDNNNHNHNTHTPPHVRSVRFVGTLDTSSDSSSSDTASDNGSTCGSFYLNAQMDACQFIQNKDLSLPLMPRKQPRVRTKTPQGKERECPVAPKKRPSSSTTTTTTAPAVMTKTTATRSNPFERTRKAVYNASCGGFGSGLYESGLDDCLGGF